MGISATINHLDADMNHKGETKPLNYIYCTKLTASEMSLFEL